MHVIIHSKTSCPYCILAKNWFKDNDIPFQEIKHDDDLERKQFYESCGDDVSSVPQIFIDNIRIGGWNDLISMKDDILLRYQSSKISLYEDF